MRIVRTLFLATLAVVVLIVGAGLVVVTTLGRETLVPPVAARVKALTGRELAVRGEARVALALPPRVVLSDITFGNAPWASTPNMVEARELSLTVELMPLLSGRIELSSIELTGPRMSFEKDAQGRGNWQFEGRDTPAAAAGAPVPGLPAALVIGNVSVREGVVTYRAAPKAAVTTIAIRDLSLHTRALSGDLDIRFAGDVGELPLDLTGRVGPLDALVARRWPYPVDLSGTVAGQKVHVAARVRADGLRYAFDDLAVSLGDNAIRGTLAVDTSGPRPRAAFDLTAPALTLAALPAAVARPGAPVTAPPTAAPVPAGVRVIPDAPVDFAPLGVVDVDGKLAVDKLTLADGRDAGRLRASIALVDRKLDVTDLEVGLFGGTLAGSVSVDARDATAATVVTRLEGRAMSLGAILAVVGRARDVQGGRAEMVANLSMRGRSPRDWAGSANGTFRLVSSSATIVNPKADALAVWDKLNDAINPFRTRDPSTNLVCAVVNLPLVNGVARVDHSIAMETSKLGVSASGVLDFRNETLELVFAPKVRKGISIDFAGFSDLVRLQGPFASPQLAVDVAGSARVIASVGAAIGTGGISAVAQTLIGWADGHGPGPCQIALDGPGAASAAPAPAPAQGPAAVAAPIVEGIGRAIGKLFGK